MYVLTLAIKNLNFRKKTHESELTERKEKNKKLKSSINKDSVNKRDLLFSYF
jgi:hypothetical protein